MGAQEIHQLIDQARDSEERCRAAAARARLADQPTYAAYFDRMAAYNSWRAEQLQLYWQKARQTPPCWAEWRGTFNLLPDGQLSLL